MLSLILKIIISVHSFAMYGDGWLIETETEPVFLSSFIDKKNIYIFHMPLGQKA